MYFFSGKSHETGGQSDTHGILIQRATVCQRFRKPMPDSKVFYAQMSPMWAKLTRQGFCISDFEGDMYGTLSEELKEAISTLPITVLFPFIKHCKCHHFLDSKNF